MTTIFNVTQSNIIYAVKTYLISTAIIMSSFGILTFRSHWLVGLFDIAVAVYAEISFLALYDNAFGIPIKAEYVCKVTPLKLRMETRLENQRLSVLKRQLRSFPLMRIKVGQFYYLERDSTPNFADFVANQTFNILMAN